MTRLRLEKKAIPFVDGLKATEVQEIALEDIKADDKSFQYRLSASVGDLKHSLSSEGQKEPVDLTGSKPYGIIDGFRRVEASRALGWPSVKALVHKGISDDDAHKLAFIKNVVRRNLSPMDRANAVFQAKQRGMKAAELHEYFGLSEKQIKRYEALLDFPPEIQKPLDKGTLSMSHAKVLADFKVRDKDVADWLGRINDSGLSAKRLKRALKQALGAKSATKPKLYIKKAKNGFRMYPFSIAKEASQAEKDRVLKALQEAIDMLRG